VPDAGAGDVWSYNPCYSFTENSCNDVAVSIHVILIVLLLHVQRQIFYVDSGRQHLKEHIEIRTGK